MEKTIKSIKKQNPVYRRGFLDGVSSTLSIMNKEITKNMVIVADERAKEIDWR